PTLRETCVSMLRMQGFDVASAGRGDEAMDLLRRRPFDILLLDLYMAPFTGLDLLRVAIARRPETLVIVMTGNPSVASNVEALELGGWDYLPKPFSATHLEVVVGRAAHVVRTQRAQALAVEAPANPKTTPDVEPLGTSTTFRAALELARKVARSNASVFLTGESGSGKELFAQFIHAHSRAAKRPLVAVNCAALPEPLLESEMFGHYKGAFTGAIRDKAGLFEAADGSTLFLDELTEMAQSIQAKLLRVIQDGAVRRVGGNGVDATVNVRFIAATNRDPAEAVRQGQLRSDLYYRLNVVPIRVPALRERPEDIPLLAQHFLQRVWQRDYPRMEPPRFSEDAVDALVSHGWRGNVRELQNMVERVVVLTDPGSDIHASDIPFARTDVSASDDSLSGNIDFSKAYHEARESVIADFERRYLASLVDRAKGNMTKAARLAGVDRTTVYRLIEKHELEKKISLRSR
ncbi:MAG: sigma-54-dependent transcriptional regulator, partial [Longimicrobiales bacterium]